MAIHEHLKKDLLSEIPIEQVFQKHVIDRSSHVYECELNNTDLEYQHRHDLAKSVGVNINDVVIVGSGKLGFSLKTPDFLPFDEKFRLSKNFQQRSDIDFAIVNRRYFDALSERLFLMSRCFERDWINENWHSNVYHPENSAPNKLYNKYI
jgi:hypothetical protein